MRILLISPPYGASYLEQALAPLLSSESLAKYSSQPLGIAYLGSTLREAGFDVKIIDMVAHTWSAVESDFKRIEPDIVGISCFTDRRFQSFRTAVIAKRLNPDVKILMGGPHATFFPQHVFQLAPVDAVVMGEGEVTLVELVKAMEKEENLHRVKGIAFSHDGKVFITDPRPFIEDIDSLPFPMYDGFDLRRYMPEDAVSPEEYRKFVLCNVITSRGCPFQCQFCSTSRFWGKRWRARFPGNVVNEVQMLHDEYGVRLINFFDDNFTLNKERVIGICREILDRKLDVVWVAQTRVDCVDRELLTWMRKAGCFQINYGVESGSDRILKNINKGFTADDAKAAFKLTHEAGIIPNAFLMVGNPGEDVQTINETIQLIKEIKPSEPPSCAITQVFPNTPLYELAKQKGIVSNDYWLTDSPAPFYTGEHTYEELLLLWARLKLGTRSKARCIKWLLEEGLSIGSRHPKIVSSLIATYLRNEFDKLRAIFTY